jgi:hypothetical protein
MSRLSDEGGIALWTTYYRSRHPAVVPQACSLLVAVTVFRSRRASAAAATLSSSTG